MDKTDKMSKILTIQLILRPDSYLIALDNTPELKNLIDYVSIEYLFYKNEYLIEDSIQVKDLNNYREPYDCRFNTEIYLNKDGMFNYYKLIIPRLIAYKNQENYDIHLNDIYIEKNLEKEDTIYRLISIENLDYSDITSIKNHSIEYEYIDEVYKDLTNLELNYGSQCFYSPNKIVFNVAHLQKCLVNLQKKLLLTNKNCTFDNCNSDRPLRNRRDFLLSALYVFDYLKDIKNFTEAQRILENLSTCESICNYDINITQNNYNCNCNGNTI